MMRNLGVSREITRVGATLVVALDGAGTRPAPTRYPGYVAASALVLVFEEDHAQGFGANVGTHHRA